MRDGAHRVHTATAASVTASASSITMSAFATSTTLDALLAIVQRAGTGQLVFGRKSADQLARS